MDKRYRTGLAFLLVTMTVLFSAGVAGAQDGDDPYVAPSPTVASATSIAPSPTAAPRAEVLGAQAEGPEVQRSSLAFTGGDAAGLAAIGAVALAGGAVLLGARRRHAASATP